MLLEYKVDLCMWGHHHTYQRTKPVFNVMVVSPASPHYLEKKRYGQWHGHHGEVLWYGKLASAVIGKTIFGGDAWFPEKSIRLSQVYANTTREIS